MHIGHLQIVIARAGDAFEHHSPVVADVAGGPALEWRQSCDGLGGMPREKRADVRQWVRGDAGPPAVYELLRELAFGAHDRDRIGRKERVAAEVLVVGGAVEQGQEREGLKPSARGERIGGGDELVDQRHGVAHRRPPSLARPARARLFADTCVSFTCSGPRSSGGVR